MVRAVYATLLLLSVTTHVRTQFFDFFSALQPIGQQTLRPLFQLDLTTKRQRTTKTTRRPESTTKRNTPFSFYSEALEREKQKTKNAQIGNDYYSTTTKPSRKTTKSNTIRRHYDSNSRDNVNINSSNNNKLVSKETNNNRNNKSRSISNSRDVNVHKLQASSQYNNDRLIFDDGRRNTVINYETTKPFYTTKYPYLYENKKNVYTTSRPYTIRPGVKPAVVNGPPITNRPPTKRPSFGPQSFGDDVSPELIIGPNEDYMTTVEKKRYIEMAEKMCDKYKALDIKQIQAIPLVPSPDPVRVNVSTCTPVEAALVVGGRVASIQEFRHMALLGWSHIQAGGYSWKCGGSLVSSQYVLTAAHCAYQDRDNSVVIGPPQVVQLGSSYLDDPGAVVVRVAAVIRHPKYKQPKSYYDIALVKMTQTVTFSSVIKPACLGIPPPPGKPIIATGWGRTEFGGDQSEELRSVSLPIWDMTECYNVLGTTRRLPQGPSSDSQICAGEKKGGKDTCQGDSGGPAQIQDGCSWRVVAVTSVGRSCGAAQTPALYAKVPRAFISAVVFGGQLSNNNNQNSNNNQQSNSNNQNNNQQSNNNNQWNNQQSANNNQWNNQQSNNNNQESNKTPQWNTNQQSSNQQQNNNNQQWNNNQQSTNQWNIQQQSNNNQRKPNNNQQNLNNQDNIWTWNRHQGEASRNPEYNNQPQSNNQWNNNNQESNNNKNNQNIKRNEQSNNYDTQNGNSNVYNSNNQNVHQVNYNQNNNNQYDSGQYNNNGQYDSGQYNNNRYTTEKPVYNKPSGYNNGYKTEQPVYNQPSYINGYTSQKPVYNQQGGYKVGYTTEKPVYNQQGGYNNGYITEKPIYNQQSGYNVGFTTERPVYNQQSGFNNGFTTEKPVYNQNSGYYSGDYDAVVPSGFPTNHRVYNDERVWWT